MRFAYLHAIGDCLHQVLYIRAYSLARPFDMFSAPPTLYQGNEAHGVLARNLIVKMAGSGLGEGHMGKTYGQSTKLPNRELGPWEGL